MSNWKPQNRKMKFLKDFKMSLFYQSELLFTVPANT